MVLIKSAVVALVLIQLITPSVSIDLINENDDLVFDQDGRSGVHVPFIKKETDDGLSLFGRVKRQTLDWLWGGSDSPSSTAKPPAFDWLWGESATLSSKSKSSDEALKTTPESPLEFVDQRIEGAHHRRGRNSEEAIDETNNINDKEDENNEDSIGIIAAGRVARPQFGNTDDEDLTAGSGEVEGSATDGSTPHFIPSGEETHNRQARFYRITLKVLEPYVPGYADTYSPTYLELSRNLTNALNELLSHEIPNYNHFANVVKVSPAEDRFDSEVTLDVGSTYTNENEIRRILENQLRYHSLGSIKVSPDGFTFRSFEECPETTSLKCRDGTCVPLSSRCDGIPQCPDHSDEHDCSAFTSVTTPTTTSTTTSTTPSTTTPTTTTTTTTSSTTTEQIFEETSVPIWNETDDRTIFNNRNDSDGDSTRLSSTNNCRGDDTVRCSDGSRYICSVQQCDGVPDCNDGADEEGCGPSCGAGEFSCDVSRCIFEKQHCDFIEDCDDGSDERGCSYPACVQNEFRCRNGQCIDNRQRCNGVTECRDKSDELNCPCKDDEFECAALYCIPRDQRCDGVHQCSNGRDELGCVDNTRCRSDEFKCDDGSCVNEFARCDGRSDCPDRSDERNCTVTICNSDQFRCADGTCVSIDKRCNGYNDCRNGEDESQCGCGATEYHCNDGQCIAYELQCNGYNDCRDGSDERDCDKFTWRNVKNSKSYDALMKQLFLAKSQKLMQSNNNEEMKYIEPLTSDNLIVDLPHSGKNIVDPIGESFPELIPNSTFTSNNIGQKSFSHKNEWEFIGSSLNLKNSSTPPKIIHRTNKSPHFNIEMSKAGQIIKEPIIEAFPEIYQDERTVNFNDSIASKLIVQKRNKYWENIMKSPIFHVNPHKNGIHIDDNDIEAVLDKKNKTSMVYRYMQKLLASRRNLSIHQTQNKPVTIGPPLSLRVTTNAPLYPDTESLTSFHQWLHYRNQSLDDWNEFEKSRRKYMPRKTKKFQYIENKLNKYRPELKYKVELQQQRKINDKSKNVFVTKVHPMATINVVKPRQSWNVPLTRNQNKSGKIEDFDAKSISISINPDNERYTLDRGLKPMHAERIQKYNSFTNFNIVQKVERRPLTAAAASSNRAYALRMFNSTGGNRFNEKIRPGITAVRNYMRKWNINNPKAIRLKRSVPQEIVEKKLRDIHTKSDGDDKKKMLQRPSLDYDDIERKTLNRMESVSESIHEERKQRQKQAMLDLSLLTVGSLRKESDNNAAIIPPADVEVFNITAYDTSESNSDSSKCHTEFVEYWRNKYFDLYNRTKLKKRLRKINHVLIDSLKLNNSRSNTPDVVTSTVKLDENKIETKVQDNEEKHDEFESNKNDKTNKKPTLKPNGKKRRRNKNGNGGKRKKNKVTTTTTTTTSSTSVEIASFPIHKEFFMNSTSSDLVNISDVNVNINITNETLFINNSSVINEECAWWDLFGVFCIKNSSETVLPTLMNNFTENLSNRSAENITDNIIMDISSSTNTTFSSTTDIWCSWFGINCPDKIPNETDIEFTTSTIIKLSNDTTKSDDFAKINSNSTILFINTNEIVYPLTNLSATPNPPEYGAFVSKDTYEPFFNNNQSLKNSTIIDIERLSLELDTTEELNNISYPIVHSCKDDEHECDHDKCIGGEQVCDGVHDCVDESDENDCEYFFSLRNDVNARLKQLSTSTFAPKTEIAQTTTTTIAFKIDQTMMAQCNPQNHFVCYNGECIKKNYYCNGFVDCPDGSDESPWECDHYRYDSGGLAPCPTMDFTCGDGSCIPNGSVCDGFDDCPRAEDELNCDRGCTPTQFKCATGGKCLEDIYKCDGYPDCPDKSDEDCGVSGTSNDTITHSTSSHTNFSTSNWVPDRTYQCDPRTEMRCGNGQCVSLRRRCDGVPDCYDNSDEKECGNCAIDEIRCNSGECLPERVRCDGRSHCRDGSDETGCVNECPAGMFRCDDGLCLDERRRCDGRSHCRDGSDEINCQSPYCPSGQLACANGVCILAKFFCDHNVDCRDGSDEDNCPGTTTYPSVVECRSDEYTCDDRTCIPMSAVCDNRRDCAANEDESNCQRVDESSLKSSSGILGLDIMTKSQDNIANVTTTRICAIGDFVCADGTCIPAAHRCDNFYDCRDFTDEQFCLGCVRGQFQCNNGDCISGEQKCDRMIDCDDGSDEEECEITTTPTTPEGRHCPSGQFTCVTDRSCVYYSARCNGIPECRDGSDEDGCNNTGGREELNLKTYPSEQIIKETPMRQGREVVFQCRDEGPLRARVRWLRGNNLPLPPGARDINGRLEIPNIQLDHAGPYICEAVGYSQSTAGQRITVHLEVEKFDPPPTRPPQVCKYDEATCSNGDCIPKSHVCDGEFHCVDGSDEMRCNPHGCEPNQFRCASKQCVSKIWRCDGDKDCADGSDEENCGTPPPGSSCRYDEFQCQKYDQCIPKSYHCDMERDCQDGSDEIGCSPVYIIKPPVPMVVLVPGETMILDCTAIGVPIPEINWRLNWGHVPSKCNSISTNGTGTLTCPDIAISDQGAYSCEAINVGGFVFAVPDAILVVKDRSEGNPCPRGTFNNEARRREECISCFCFGVVNECRSADLFTYQILPPFDRHKVVAVEYSPYTSTPRIRGDLGNQIAEIQPLGRDGVDISIPYSNELISSDIPYFALPEDYLGSQLKSYGGYLKYTVRYRGEGRNNSAPSIILSGNGNILIHRGRAMVPEREIEESVRFFYGEWYKADNGSERLATRQDIMMTLANVDNILIKAKYDDSPQLDVAITEIVMDSAKERNSGLGSASYVEECSCPAGYTGLSCEHCAPGFLRRKGGSWLGDCYRDEPTTCAPGYYGDPQRNIPCSRCACPLTNPANQFARTCRLGSNQQPVCDCPPGYTGERCQQCAPGYHGNPLIPGDMCVRDLKCDPHGSFTTTPDTDGKCRCKQYATGLICDQCKPNTFNPSAKNQFGCISCFCMGITNRCAASSWYRNEIHVSFTNSIRDFSLVDSSKPTAPVIVSGIHLDSIKREISYRDFPNHGNGDVYYWQLPSIFLGDQVTSYGGNLKYTVRYIPSPGGQSSRNNAADVELISSNDIKLLYYSHESPEPTTQQSFSVPLLEQFWQRTDGIQADREHLLMALADIQAIRIKATYTTHTDEAAISLVSLDTAEKYNTGKERAVEVEECSCPVGYSGLSCEDCAVGYTRAIEGLYLGICEPCNCNGHSSQCDSETGICENCADHTTGESCELCEVNYEGDATRGTPDDCKQSNKPTDSCEYCSPEGAEYPPCMDGRCICKSNVEGPNCNRCRPSTFGLSIENPDGCIECYCSGVSDQCHESSLNLQEIPMWVYDTRHGFTITDTAGLNVIDDSFDINVAMNEIGFRFTPANRNNRLFWSLPPTFTGNKIKSYGGNLTLTQRYNAYPGTPPIKDQDVILSGNGITLFWTNPHELMHDRATTYSVPLRESEWRRLTMEGPRSASRTDLMTVLSNLESILVRATYNEGMVTSHISDIILDTAVENLTGKKRATLIEACRCPVGYIGTSCESCARGYYRDTTDRSISVLGSCNPCPCNDHEESCEISRGGQVKCNCLSGYTGQYCQETAELRVGLMPIKPEAVRDSTIEFKCEYHHGYTLYIYFKLLPYNGLPLTAWAMNPGPLVPTYNGAHRLWNVHVGQHPCNVECSIMDRYGNELATISTTILPVDYPTTEPYPTSPPLTPPKIIVSIQEKKFQIVHIGSTVRYHCSGRSLDHNPIHIRWEKEGGRLPDRSLDDAKGLLIINDVRVSDSGVYICQVTDGVDVAVEKVTLTIGGSSRVEPKATITPLYQQVKEGEPAEFKCEASGNPPPELEWIRVQGEMNPESSFYNGVWRIPAVTERDAAEYKCIARNAIGIGEQTTILYVTANPDRPPTSTNPDRGPIITPKEWIGASGDIVRLVCSRSQYHSQVSWTRSAGLPLPPSAIQRDGVLTIDNPGPSDSGMYICIATSYQGTESTTSARIAIHPKRNPLHVRVEPERQVVSQGTVAEIKCYIDARDGLVVKWVKHGESSLGPNAQQHNNTLKIMHPQVSDRGVYICRATNAAGTFEASAMIEVQPREIPALELYPRNTQTVTIGGSVDLQCRVTAGLPTPEVRWSRQDGRNFAANIEQHPGGLLRITNTTINDGGAYVCSASNEVGTSSAIAHIETQSIPVITITPNNGIVQVKLGSRVRLTCSAHGIPQPTVIWSKHGGTYQLFTPVRSSPATPLTAIHEIMSMSLDDEGSYTCTATNAAGITEERIQVRIEDDDYNDVNEFPPCRGDVPCDRPGHRPGSGSRFEPATRTNEGVRIPEDYLRIPNGGKVEMRCQVIGPDDSRIYLDWKRSDRRPLPSGSTVHGGILTIPDVTRDAAGEYVCLGLNHIGAELFRAISHLQIISPPRIELNPNRQTVAPGESPSIHCSAIGDQPLKIEWSAIGRALPHSVSHDQGILRFHGITFDDAGKYVCKASNDAGMAEAVAEVLVNENTYDNVGVRAVERDVNTLAGNSVTLRCETHDRVSIHWTRDGQQLPSNSRIGENSLELSRVKPDDSGRYICRIRNAHGGSSDYINLHVAPPAGPVVHIVPSSDIVNIGDTIDLRCVLSSRQQERPRYQWIRADHESLPANTQVYEDNLRIVNVQMSDSGIYRCRVDSREGGFVQEYHLIIQGGENDEPAIEMKSVPYDSSIEMGCRVDMDGPITYKWSKLGGLLPVALMRDNIMTLVKVKAEDAGTYICTASNGVESSEVPTVLVVTGVIPNFSQAPRSYIALPPVPDSYLKFNIEVSFKPENYDGIILYNPEDLRGDGDFILLSLVNGYPEFSFDLGSGPATIRSQKPVTLGEWHTIKLQRNRKDALMLVDGEGPYKATAIGRKQGLDLKEALYVGGVPEYVGFKDHSTAKRIGFVGCVSKVVIGDKTIDLIGDQTDSIGVTTCETCAENPCRNSGVCQEAPTTLGYTCLCRAGFSGKDCTNIGESCYPGVCGQGSCSESDGGLVCSCPVGTTGRHCEHTVEVQQPAFRSQRSFLAYQTPKAARRLKISMNFNPSDNGDGILMYSSQSDEGHGDFIALVIKDRLVEFRFDIGSGMAVVRSNYVIQPGVWTRVTLNRDFKDGKLSVNGEPLVEGRAPGSARSMTLNTPLYIGGVNRSRITINKKVDVIRSFHGCINEVEVSSLNLHLLKSAIDSSNIEECHISSSPWRANTTFATMPVFRHEHPTTPGPTYLPPISSTDFYDFCVDRPCIHGVCQKSNDHYGYSCTCEYGYVGINCENVLKQCELLTPCRNTGTCTDLHGSYKCDCPLGFNGKNCEKQVEIAYDVAFRGDGWLEIDRSVMPHEERLEVIGFEISTNKSDGLIMWHGQTPNDLNQDDYMALAIVDGYVEYQYNLGSGSAVIRVTTQRVDDSERHRIILKRQGSEGSIELNGDHIEHGESYGLQQILNARGSIYLGGVPDYAMTYGKFQDGFSGCIYTLEVQDSGAIDIGNKAIRGKNVAPCTRDSTYSANDLPIRGDLGGVKSLGGYA